MTDTGADPPATAAPAPALPSSMPAKATNFVVFQLVYSACVLGAAHGWLWLGPAAGAVLLPVNLLFIHQGQRTREVRLWLLCGLIGFAVDSILLGGGLISFPEVTRWAPDAGVSGWLVPPWIVTLWVAVGSLLHSSLGWLAHRPWLAMALGAVGGPLSFWSGSRLGAVGLPQGNISIAALALEYAVLMPALLSLAYRRPRSIPAPSGDGPSH